jgi:hypothetical protein
MACPNDVTIEDLSGVWVMVSYGSLLSALLQYTHIFVSQDKTFSSDADPMLALVCATRLFLILASVIYTRLGRFDV